MAQVKAELEYEKFRALTSADPRPVDFDFDEATRQLPALPRPKKPKPRKG